MRKAVFAGLALLLVAGAAALPRAARAATAAAEPQRNQNQSRTLTGQVQDSNGAAVAQAVVYLKNTKTLAVKTFIADANGNYRFHALSVNVDYEVWADKEGRRSDTKTLSSFDSRAEAVINLQLK